MNGKVIVSIIVACALGAGIAIYYLQVYGYYYEVTPTPGQDVKLTRAMAQLAEPVAYDNFRAIDADSSPIRYRACFDTSLQLSEITSQYTVLQGGEPLVAPGWFDCFDAEAIGAGIEDGTLTVFLGEKNVEYGVDRVVAIAPDGRGWAWHELNDCGHKAYDGTVVGEECPPKPEG